MRGVGCSVSALAKLPGCWLPCLEVRCTAGMLAALLGGALYGRDIGCLLRSALYCRDVDCSVGAVFCTARTVDYLAR